MLQATERLFKNVDNGYLNGVVLLDLSMAVNTVDHTILLNKLNLYVITGKTSEWFSSYLFNRSQSCMVNDVLTQSRYLTTVVPQESTLGTLILNLYKNDLPNCLEFTTPRLLWK